ncbi:hypothetical protein HanHA300_Chr10g0356121 [Helianthus annuus]|nr:hypothetical protein HanHA300_Chr10g0356121 [Helianthus annuus]KAJ0529424.1 hypothetical protein HanHA89_Chr10g0377711 [Helianthus annuus]
MSFERGEDHHHPQQNHPSPPPQDTKAPPFFMATTNKPYSNTSSHHTFLDQQLQFVHHQEHHHHDNNQISFNMINNHSLPSSSSIRTNNIMCVILFKTLFKINFICVRNDGDGPYDLTDLDQSLFLYGDGQAATTGGDLSAFPIIQDHHRRESLGLFLDHEKSMFFREYDLMVLALTRSFV